MSNLPRAHIAHHTPNRLRVKIPSKKKDSEYFSQLQQYFSKLDGVAEVEFNPETGSILLIKAPDPRTVGEFAKENHLFDLIEGRQEPRTPTESIVASLNPIDTRLRGFTRGEVDVRSLASIGLIGLGVYQLGRRRFALPAWYTALWYAYMVLTYR